mmetsp:Transcript_2480/g.5670  ORF Transcript_2480/g.5670 Transcript_2480/m.5670 type:complete len:306 (-) Transcript_2480:167-1084(-)
MHNLGNLVDEDHDLVLEDLGAVGKILDLAISKNTVHHAAWDHGIDPGGVAPLHILADNLSSSLSKPQGKKTADLNDGLLQDYCLHGLLLLLALPKLRPPLVLLLFLQAKGSLLLPVCPVSQLNGRHGRVPDHQQLPADSLNWIQDQVLGPGGQGYSGTSQQDTNEEGLPHIEQGFECCVCPLVKIDHDDSRLLLQIGVVKRGENSVVFLPPQLLQGATNFGQSHVGSSGRLCEAAVPPRPWRGQPGIDMIRQITGLVIPLPTRICLIPGIDRSIARVLVTGNPGVGIRGRAIPHVLHLPGHRRLP